MWKFNPKLFNSLSLFLLLMVVLLLANSYLSFLTWQRLRTDLTSLSEVVSVNQNQLTQTRAEIALLQQVNQEGLARLEVALEAEKESRELLEAARVQEKVLAQQQLFDLEKKISTANQIDLTKVVNQWSPYVVSLLCNFYTKHSTLLLQSSGSGLLVQNDNGDVGILTNRHIITAMSINRADLVASECTVSFPQKNLSISSSEVLTLNDEYDWGWVALNTTNSYIQTLLQTSPQLCSQNPFLGSSVAILGYPSIGDQKNVTVTEGIISGFDTDYFITSAKVEKGNSGGAAISLEDDCYLGTPTYSLAGEIESLARILDVRVLQK